MKLKWRKRRDTYYTESGKYYAVVYRVGFGPEWECNVIINDCVVYWQGEFCTRKLAQLDAERWIEEHGE